MEYYTPARSSYLFSDAQLLQDAQKRFMRTDSPKVYSGPYEPNYTTSFKNPQSEITQSSQSKVCLILCFKAISRLPDIPL